MNWLQHKKLLLKNPAFQKALQELAPEFQIARSVIEARLSKGLSQQQLAQRLHTRQSVISRVENAKTLPSLAFLKRAAKALDVSFQVHVFP